MYKSKMIQAALLVACSLLVATAGCSTKSGNSGSKTDPSPSASGQAASPSASAASALPSGADTSKPVELIWYYPNPEVPKDVKLVQDAVSKIAKDKINATVKLMPIPTGEYNDKMNAVVGSGEKADIIWTSSWAFSYITNTAKGAFAPLDELLAKYGKDIMPLVPKYLSEGVKIGGVTYAVPNYQTMTTIPGYIVQKEYVQKYGLDTAQVKKSKDLEPFLAQVKAGSPGVIPFAVDKSGPLSAMINDYDYRTVLGGIAVIKKSDPYKVLKMSFVPEYDTYLDTVRDWYKKGYINQDAPTLKTINDVKKTGKVVSLFSSALNPGGEATEETRNGGHPVQYIVTGKPQVTTDDILGTLNAISAKSENKERAMMFLNLVNTNKELYHLLALGIEGKHYTKNADGTVKLIKDSGYITNVDWVFGNTFNGMQPEEKGLKVLEETKKLNESAEASPILGFVFNADPVNTQISNVGTVNDKYQPALNTGAIDKGELLAEFREKLTAAGIDTIIAEIQKQLDEWVKANNKK
ncbi:ABC transporter substrate-binding protein [Paenibacillus cymbidii]|uniref:ABC transporter substrate-binding protein n=1 Tax=Paenibacillus cymbidii TaxID=1639034 RepID=UPI001081E0C1|nr:ABC transporter substrate-binding protein [Paenibacillus cymbidii]